MRPLQNPPTWAAVWFGSPFLRLIVVLYLGILFWIVAVPDHALAGLLVVFLLHAILGMLSLIPRHALFGKNLLRLPIMAANRQVMTLTFDDGPDPEVTPKVLDLLDRYKMRGSFFVVGTQVQAHPALAQEIVRRGHSLENHTEHHFKLFSLLGPRGLWQEVANNQAIIARFGGQEARFFRPTAGFRSPLLAPILAHLGLTLATWTRRGFDTREQSPQRVLDRLCRNLVAGDILLLHDGHSARGLTGAPVILTVLPLLLEFIQSKGLISLPLPEACGLEAERAC
jgi:peptidoglycan/xylan/chitin deacetylase (PgdA/CDA1 family)